MVKQKYLSKKYIERLDKAMEGHSDISDTEILQLNAQLHFYSKQCEALLVERDFKRNKNVQS